MHTCAVEANVGYLRYTSKMSADITVLFSRLTLHYNEIGIHRGRKWGFREVFGFRTLHDLPFLRLARKVKQAYEGHEVPAHKGWPAQQEALAWLIERGHEGIYSLNDNGISISPTPFRSYYILDGHHRALALYILGEREVRAWIKPYISG